MRIITLFVVEWKFVAKPPNHSKTMIANSNRFMDLTNGRSIFPRPKNQNFRNEIQVRKPDLLPKKPIQTETLPENCNTPESQTSRETQKLWS